MSKYIKLEDAISKIVNTPTRVITNNLSPLVDRQHEIIDMLADLPTIEVSEDCISREYIVKKLKSSKEFYLSAWGSFANMDDKDKARCDELNNCIATVINAPSVVTRRAEGEEIER